MIRDSIAVSVIFYVFWLMAENFGVVVGQLDTFTGFLFTLDSRPAFFFFILFFSSAGILFCKTLAHMWSGDSHVKVLVYSVLLFSADIVFATLQVEPFSFTILAGFAEKFLFSLVYLSFARMRAYGNQPVIKETMVESRITTSCARE